jgi:MFS family permease
MSPLIGRAIDRRGGRPVMTAGSVLTALGCLGLALSRGPLAYYAAWACLGLAMRMTLYDAAFAALARIGGGTARRPISQITLRRPSGPSATSWTSSSVGAALFWSTPPWRSSSPCRFT